MALISHERLAEILAHEADPTGIPRDYDGNPWWFYSTDKTTLLKNEIRSYNRNVVMTKKYSAEEAAEILQQIKDRLLEFGSLGKYGRPWDLDPKFIERLDPDQVWWGFEFETGYRTKEDQIEVLSHTWDTWDGVAFDSEGEGYWATEITFPPQEMAKYEDGTADAMQFMKYLTDNKDKTYCSGAVFVGTHFNLRIPGIGVDDCGRLARGLSRSLRTMGYEDSDRFEEMFGRRDMYGFFGGRGEEHPYLEGKLFRTTYDWEQFQQYIEVCKLLTRMALLLKENLPINYDYNVYIPNLWEVYNGREEPIVKKYFTGGYEGDYWPDEDDYDDEDWDD